MTLSLGPYQPDSFTALKPPRVANQVGTALAAPAARWYRVAGKGARVPTILIVEDEPEITALLCSYLEREDRKSTRLNSSHVASSYAVFCLKKKIDDR